MPDSAPTYATLADWISREVVPLDLSSPETCNAAIDKVVALMGELIEVLGLGEALHGGEEILLLRNRLFERLAQRHGYTAIAIESSFQLARLVNEYVAGSPQTSEAVQEAGFSHGYGKVDANRELIEWMRSYNADASHTAKLRFDGFDAPTGMAGFASPRQPLGFVLDYLASVKSPIAAEQREKIETLIGDDFQWENPAALMDPSKSVGRTPTAAALRIAVDDLISELRMRSPELVADSGEERFLEALHYTSIAGSF